MMMSSMLSVCMEWQLVAGPCGPRSYLALRDDISYFLAPGKRTFWLPSDSLCPIKSKTTLDLAYP